MAWIESHQSLATHRKTMILEAELGITRAEAIGHLHLFWWWALDNAPNGNLKKISDEAIAKAALWPGDATKFFQALIKAGFINRNRSIHDWTDYAGKLIEKRTKSALNHRDMRKAYTDGIINAVRARDGNFCRYCGTEVDWTDRKGALGGTYDHINPSAKSALDNLVVCCRSCNSKKGKRTLIEAGFTLLDIKSASNAASNADQATVPNRTQPNSTIPYRTVTTPAPSKGFTYRGNGKRDVNAGNSQDPDKYVKGKYGHMVQR